MGLFILFKKKCQIYQSILEAMVTSISRTHLLIPVFSQVPTCLLPVHPLEIAVDTRQSQTINVNVICYSAVLMIMQLLIWSSNVSWFIIKPKGCDPTCHLAASEGQQLKEYSAQYLTQTHTLTHINIHQCTRTPIWTHAHNFHRHKHPSITLNVCCQSPSCLSCLFYIEPLIGF